MVRASVRPQTIPRDAGGKRMRIRDFICDLIGAICVLAMPAMFLMIAYVIEPMP